MKVLLERADLRIPFIYAIFGGLWVVLSDRLLAGLFADISVLTSFQTYKGWAFVGASTVLVYLLLHREIGRREQVEQTLQENSNFTANLLENSPFSIYITGIDHRLRLVNGQWEKDLGIPRAQAIGRPLVQIFPAEIADRLNRDNRNVIESGSRLELEEEVYGRHYLTIKFPVRDASGGIAGVGGVSLDVTERRRAEQELEASQERYLKLGEHFPNGTVSTYNRDLRMTFVAGQDLKDAGVTANDLEGRKFEDLAMPETVAIALPHLHAAFEGLSGTYEAPHWGGLHYLVNVTPLTGPDGTIDEIMAVTLNITERRRAEEALRASEER
ncbi:MAG TPA: PAS domain-containing protein, partial [Anaerolineales bacterium]|nr:PAS domain-containing protein [Anaerolineales bacterium]